MINLRHELDRFTPLVGGALVLALAAPVGRAEAQGAATQSPPARSAALGPAHYFKAAGTMWTFDAPPLAYWKREYGFTPDQSWLDHVRLASLRLPGCSASFVSADGLVLTNHHCARPCVASASPADTNYSVTGFVASSPADEKRCSTLYVDQLQSIENVTSQVRAAITAATPAAQVAQRDSVIGRIERACGGAGQICQVVSLYQGGMYSLYRYKRYTDIRLVMVPEEATAFFGGDPDNFTYPRYDLDMALLRVYEDDKPYHPADYFRFSTTGAKDGALVFVTGNPGSTGRLLTLAQMRFLRDIEYPATLGVYARGLGVLDTLIARDSSYARRFENLVFGIQNSVKAVRGYRSGLVDTAIMARKAEFERDLRARVAADPALRAKYASAWPAIARAEGELQRLGTKLVYYNFSPNAPFGSRLLNLAGGIVRLPREAALPDAKRLPQYRGDGLKQIRAMLLSDQPVDTLMDRLALAAYLRAAQRALPAGDPYLRAVLGGRSPDAAAAELVGGTSLASHDARAKLVEGGAAAVARSTDPMIVLARTIEPLSRRVQARSAELEAVVSANANKVGQALFAVYGTTLPPDATFTLRISDGVVKGYPYNGTIAPYHTTIYGQFGHATAFDNVPPFRLPPRWWAARDSLDFSTPLDFVSTNDIIGGNSGSPVIDRDGKLVGLIFDGNIESLPNRFIFTDAVARSVSVDSRGILEALRHVYGAPRLADELTGSASP